MTAVAVSYSAAGPEDAPVVVLSNSLGATRAMWDPQVPVLAVTVPDGLPLLNRTLDAVERGVESTIR